MALVQGEVTNESRAQDRVLVLTPVGRDGPLTVSVLREHGVSAHRCTSLAGLCTEMERGAAAAIVTSEALTDDALPALSTLLRQQPPWSDIPIILLADGAGQGNREAKLLPAANVTVLERPVRLPSLLSAVRAAVRARRRQYQVRDLLEQAERARADAELQQAHIEALNERLQRAMTETHHRVKNNLQIIAAMVDLRTMDDADTVSVEELKRLSRHVQALASVHDLLTHSAKEDGQAHYVSARDILEKLLPVMQQTAGNRRIEFDLEDARLTARQGTSMALVANELVSNAVKHGERRIGVRFSRRGEHAILEVSDDGPGFPADFDAQRYGNTGLELVENLSRWDLGGRTRYDNLPGGGARVQVTIPLP